jgi:uncharacterized membrane protein
MSLEPFFEVPLVVQAHVVGALLALVLGPLAMLRRRRDFWHKALGYGFVLAMSLTACSAAFIYSLRLIGPFSPIHLLIPLTLYSLWMGVRLARRGEVKAHRAQMASLYWQAIGVAGLFTFLPTRLMNELVFGGGSWLGFAGVAVVGGVFMVWLTRRVTGQVAGPAGAVVHE